MPASGMAKIVATRMSIHGANHMYGRYVYKHLIDRENKQGGSYIITRTLKSRTEETQKLTVITEFRD